MNPFFFGRSECPLFGIYHAPKGNARPMGVVLCPPIGQEYMRTHRALRQLSLQLNKSGAHALRFDYSGVGDSSGVDAEATMSAWLGDVCAAIDELKDTAGVANVSVVGIRLGASLAYLATQARTDIDQVVLWDPVVKGSDYVAELIGVSETPQRNAAAAARGETIGVGAFALTASLRRDVEAIDLCAIDKHAAKRLFLVTSEERPEYPRLRDHLAVVSDQSRYSYIAGTGSWVDAEQMGAVLLPQAIIQAVVASLG